jgi:arginyl-tRNA synthetase
VQGGQEEDVDYAIDRLVAEARSAILATGLVPAALIELEAAKAGVSADLAFPTFRAAKERGVAPARLAQELAATVRVTSGSLVGEVAASGPYLNVIRHVEQFAAAVFTDVERLGPRYGHDEIGAGRTIVVDYSSPNVAKRMHVGNIRSTIIGQALVNILAALGYRTVGDNHLGDWGKSFGILLLALEREGWPDGQGESLLVALERLYATYSTLAARDPALDQAARDWSLRLERNDPLTRALAERAVVLTMHANRPSYDRLGVRFDHAHGESFYAPLLTGVVQEAIDKGVAHRDESGAVVVDLGGGLPTFLLQRSDGGSLYHSRDAAAIKYRVHEFAPAQIVYVVGAPQELYLRQLFALARALGYADGVDLVHVPFGLVMDTEGQALSTRRGNMVYLESLLDEAHARAQALVEQATHELPANEREAIAEAVGVGAVIYNDLHQDPKRTITLEWDRMLAFQGNSAPYIQYMYARCRSILARAGADGAPTAADPALLVHPAESALVRQLARLPVAVRKAGAEYSPVVVAEWSYHTARALAAFYRDCPVVAAESASLRAARLRLVAATARTLRNGLALLGIKTPERL